mmetsp:Transcript_7952/g.11696  ORF Transcript_7952/g.11696 Transcript_7952/m.11696 type:complete len:468 (-) Transcript_7952:34-1437(-)
MLHHSVSCSALNLRRDPDGRKIETDVYREGPNSMPNLSHSNLQRSHSEGCVNLLLSNNQLVGDGRDQKKHPRRGRSLSVPNTLHAMHQFFASTARVATLNLPTTTVKVTSADKQQKESPSQDTTHHSVRESFVSPKEDANKEALRNTPLNDAIAKEEWSNVERWCENEPTLASCQVGIHVEGERTVCLPLYSACCHSPTLTSVHALLVAFPPSALTIDSGRGRLPIHAALLNRASVAVVQYLVHTHPDCLRVQDNDGNLPLHIAALFSNNTIIRILFCAYPEGCKVANIKGKLPLHILCARWTAMTDSQSTPSNTESLVPSTQIIEDIKQAFPQAIESIDHRGRLPIHAACNLKNLRPDVLDVLLCDQPQALTAKDDRGLTPFILAQKMLSQSKEGEEGMKVLQSYNTKLKKKNGIRTTLSSCTPSGAWLFGRKRKSERKYTSDRVLEDRWLRKRYQKEFSPVTRKK